MFLAVYQGGNVMDYIKMYNSWLESEYCDEDTKKELLSIADNELEIKSRFRKNVEFGTGGLRGVLGAGTNRINKYIIRKVTRGLADYVKSHGKEACERGIVIAHDNRRHSIEFCHETAGVLAACGVRSYIFDSLRPTPMLSYSVRELGAFGGVMITASHNPPEYNGYKVYDERGCQLVPEVNDILVEYINKVADPLAVKSLTLKEAGDQVVRLSSDIDRKYYEAVKSISINNDVKKDIRIVYSPQHGTGNVPVRTVLAELGYCVIPVEEQCVPDTEFSKTENPNPETDAAYKLAFEYAKKNDADIIITTDPDCDRLGVAVKHEGEYKRMTGNQSAAVLLEYILSQKKKNGTLPKNGVMFNTIVTSDLGDRVCESYGVEVEKTLTGFKFIGDKIYRHETGDGKQFVFGYEESYGCLISDFARDKDAVQASLMLCEAAAFYAEQGKTLLDVLREIYDRYGYFLDDLDNFYFKGIDGADKIASLVDDLRHNPPENVGEAKVITCEDYTTDEMVARGFTRSNVLRFILDDGSWVAIRPSGTEPKCKFYFSVVAKTKDEAKAKLPIIKKAFERNL